MENQNLYEIVDNKKLTENVFMLKIKGDTSKIKFAGQFCDIKIESLFLRRPISIFDYDNNTITFVYKVIGQGTEILSNLKKGQVLDVLTGLGNGYRVVNEKNIELVGGGIGVPPLYLLAKRLIENNIKPKVILGFNTESEIILKDEFEKLGLETIICTADGSKGIKGFVTNGMNQNSYVYTCGPMPMLKAVYEKCKDGQFSFETRMGCGFGACMGCTVLTKNGAKRMCKEGPVLYKEEIIW